MTFPLALERAASVQVVFDRAIEPCGRLELIGASGAGKTTVLEAGLRRLAALGTTVLWTRGLEGGAGRPFHGLIDLFSGIDPELVSRLPALQREAVEVALAWRREQESIPPGALTAGIAAVVMGLLDRGPIVIAIDDLQWLDVETLRILEQLAHRPCGGLSVLATRRVETDITGMPVSSVVRVFATGDVVELPPLSAETLREILHGSARRALSASESDALVRLSAGNPLWAMELAGQIDDIDFAATVPPSATQLLEARIRSLSALARETLAAVGVLGDWSATDLVSMLDGGTESLAAAIDAKVVRELDGRIVPTHPLLAAAALHCLGPVGVRELHARFAERTSDAGEKAHHLDRSVAAGPETTIAAALETAAIDARSRGAIGTALGHAERARTRTSRRSSDHVRREILVAELAFIIGDFARVIEVLAPIIRSRLPVALLDRALPLYLDSVGITDGEIAESTALDFLRSVASSDPIRDAVFDSYRAELTADTPGNRVVDLSAIMKLLASSTETPVTRHRALGAVIAAQLDAGDGLNRELMQQRAALEERLTLLGLNHSVEAELALLSYQTDDIPTSRDALEHLAEAAVVQGEDVIAAVFMIELVVVEVLAGRLSAAKRWLKRFTKIDPWPVSPPPGVVKARGMIAIAEDDLDGLAVVLALPMGPGSHTQGHIVRRALSGFAAARHEDWAKALREFEQARKLAETAGIFDPGRRMWIDFDIARAQIALGRLTDAEATIGWLDEIADRSDRPLVRGTALRLRAQVALARRDLPTATTLARESITILAGSEFQLEKSWAFAELARSLCRQGLIEESAVNSTQAMALASDAQDVTTLRQMQRDVAAAEARRTQATLTPTEWKVSAAVAQGLSNKEIAAAQFVSVRTVETHVSAIYRKLQIRSRSQLARWSISQERHSGIAVS